MEEYTHLHNAMDIAGDKAKYDAEVKKILSDKNILAWILQQTTKEFQHYNIETIKGCIEDTPEVGTVPVYPGKTTDTLLGLNTEDKIPNEGEVTFDILFHAITPEKEPIKIYVNIEAQKNYYPGYDIVTRSIFYGARCLSRQMDTEFTGDDYDDIKKVYSIWICMDVPKNAENTITEYSINQKDLFGHFERKARYDLLTSIIIRLSKDETTSSGSRLHRLLGTILTDKLNLKTKSDILKDEFQISTTNTIKEGLNLMCNLSDRIEERGLEQGRINTFYELVCSGIISIEVAAQKLNQTTQQVLDGMRKAGFSIPK